MKRNLFFINRILPIGCKRFFKYRRHAVCISPLSNGLRNTGMARSRPADDNLVAFLLCENNIFFAFLFTASAQNAPCIVDDGVAVLKRYGAFSAAANAGLALRAALSFLLQAAAGR